MKTLFVPLIVMTFLSFAGCQDKDSEDSAGPSAGPVGSQTPSTDLSISHSGYSLPISGITASPWNSAADDMSPTLMNMHTSQGGYHSSFIPQFVVQPWNNGVVVAWNDQSAAAGSERVILSEIDMSGSDLSATHTAADSLGELLGMSVDESANLYLMTGDGTSVSNGAGDGVHADDRLDVQKFNNELVRQQRASMNLANFDISKVAIRSAGHSGTSRLSYGNSHLGLFFSRQTDEDYQGVIHQANMALKVATSDLSIVADGYASGHSWDLRMIYDSRVSDFIGLDLKDTLGRGVIISTPFTSFDLFYGNGSYINTNRAKLYTPKGGQRTASSPPYQWTYTRLGSIQPAADGYAVLFSTENSTTVNGDYITAPRNLAFMHVKQDWSNNDHWDEDTLSLGGDHNNQWVTHDPALNPYVTTLAQQPYLISGAQLGHKNKGLVWLTGYTDVNNEHVQKPKIVKIAEGKFLVLWEVWKASSLETVTANASDYVGTHAMLVDDYGNVLVGDTDLGSSVRLQPGDDVIAIDGKAVWVTGDAANNALFVHSVSLH